MVAESCFHCGDALRTGKPIVATLGEQRTTVCCIGCKAVAEFIYSSGLKNFYDFRSPPPVGAQLVTEQSAWQIYDSPELLAKYVHTRDAQAEATLDIGGMYCSACVWLLDNALQRLPAVQSVAVNPATRAAVIRWNAGALPFSGVLEEISRVGFRPAPVSSGRQREGQEAEYRQALKRLIVAAAAGMQVMMFAVALYAGDFFGIDPALQKFLRIVSLLVTLPILFYSARPFYLGAWHGLRARQPGMDLPVSIAISAAFLASVRATWMDAGDVYFDSVAMFVLFLSATRFLEMRARHRSDDLASALTRLLPDTALRIRDGVRERVALDRIRVGDMLSILPGDVIPVDGEVDEGRLSVDESMLTGESMPVSRDHGTRVFAGSVNRGGHATVRAVLTGASTSLAEVARLLEKARADRPPVALLADRIASHFVIAVLLISGVTGLIWMQYQPSRAFEVVLATLVVTCPCALALATPAALAAAASRLAATGFLLVRSRVLEILRPGALVVFDKTGTLTEGRPEIIETEVLSGDEYWTDKRCLTFAATLEKASEHVLARAFAGVTEELDQPLSDVIVEPGQGVEATVAGKRYRIGSSAFVGTPDSAAQPADARSHVWLGDDAGPIARFAIGDALREDAAATVAMLANEGIGSMIASGDRHEAVAQAAARTGIEDWHARMTPADKLLLVTELQSTGRQIVMVGDGINDAPVLAAADASIAMDAGTALARASADAIVLGKRLTSVANAALVAAATRRVIRQNIGWAIVYNLTAVPLAATGMLAPWMAALGMSASSLLVVLNALRLHHVPKLSPAMAAHTEPASLVREATI